VGVDDELDDSSVTRLNVEHRAPGRHEVSSCADVKGKFFTKGFFERQVAAQQLHAGHVAD
jgi:hypothetical protein